MRCSQKHPLKARNLTWLPRQFWDVGRARLRRCSVQLGLASRQQYDKKKHREALKSLEGQKEALRKISSLLGWPTLDQVFLAKWVVHSRMRMPLWLLTVIATGPVAVVALSSAKIKLYAIEVEAAKEVAGLRQLILHRSSKVRE